MSCEVCHYVSNVNAGTNYLRRTQGRLRQAVTLQFSISQDKLVPSAVTKVFLPLFAFHVM